MTKYTYANWKQKNLKPKVILKKVEKIIDSSDGRLAYSDAFEAQELHAVLVNMIYFSAVCDNLNHINLLTTALSRVFLRNGSLDGVELIGEINTVVKEKLATPLVRYNLLTSISLKPPLAFKQLFVDDVKIRILNGPFPEKYSSRSNIDFKEFGEFEDAPSNYSKIIVTLKSKSIEGAANKALKALNLMRAVYCLSANDASEIQFGHPWGPINKIRLGGVHTLHSTTGKSLSEMFWFEPNYKVTAPYTPMAPVVMSKSIKFYLDSLKKLHPKYRSVIEESLSIYVAALDERDQSIALIRLWSALENLAADSGRNYDQIVRRCSFIFRERAYHRQVLEHLRELRNTNVHACKEGADIRVNVFLLQRYFRQLVIFHLRSAGEFKNIADANSFLDLPREKSELLKQKRHIEKATKMLHSS